MGEITNAFISRSFCTKLIQVDLMRVLAQSRTYLIHLSEKFVQKPKWLAVSEVRDFVTCYGNLDQRGKKGVARGH